MKNKGKTLWKNREKVQNLDKEEMWVEKTGRGVVNTGSVLKKDQNIFESCRGQNLLSITHEELQVTDV